MASPNAFLQNFATTPKPTPTAPSTSNQFLNTYATSNAPKAPAAPSYFTPQSQNALNTFTAGVKAADPAQNIKAPTTTLTPAQQTTQPTKASTTVATPYTNTTATPQAPAAPAQQPGQTAAGFNPYTANNGLYGQLVTGLANRATASPEYTKAQADYQEAVRNLNAIKNKEAETKQAIGSQPIDYRFQQGRQGLAQQFYAEKENAAAQAVTQAQNAMNYANQQQQLQQGALGAALGYAAPVQVSPGNYLQSPLGGGAGSAAEGQQQGIEAATNWAKAQQNMQQGANYQGVAQDLSNALQVMEPIGQNLTSFMSKTGLNPATAPLINQQISKIDAQQYPDVVATMNAATNEIRSFAIQILGSQSGANPTDVTESVNSFDFSNFTPLQLSNFLDNLEKLGQLRLSQAQSASQAGYGANTQVGATAQGKTATPGGEFNTGGKVPATDMQNLLKSFGGAGLNVGQAAASTFNSQAGAFIGGGIAEKVLGL